MPNVYANLPLPPLNGPGGSVNTSTMGKTRTIVVAGSFPGALLTIEASVDGAVTFAPIVSFQDGDEKKVVEVAGEFMRVTVMGRKASVPFSANIDVASNDDGVMTLAIPLPAGNGVGPAVNASALGTFNTFIAGGAFDGARILVEVSEDGVDYAPCVLFAGRGGAVSKAVTAAFYRASVSGRRSGVPFTGTLAVGAVNDPNTGAVVGPGDSTCLVYQPGGPAVGPATFNDWNDLMAQLAAFRGNANGNGCYTIQFDDTFSSPATIPAGGPYDMTDVTWQGQDDGFVTPVDLDEGATFTRLRTFDRNLDVRTLALITSPCSDLASGDIVRVTGGSNLQSFFFGGAPFYDASGLGAGDLVVFTLFEAALLGSGGSGAVINFPVAGSFAFIFCEGVATVLPTQIFGGAGAFLQMANSSLAAVPTIFVNWAGAIFDPRLDVQPSLLPQPFLTAPAVAAMGPVFTGQWLRFDASGGAIAQTLPTINPGGGFTAPGCFVLVTEEGGGVLTAAPAAGETIAGSAAAVNVPSNGSMLFVSDGVSNWSIVATWGNDRYAPPEQWAQQNVAAGQAAVALSAQVSTNFDTWKAMRRGSVVGLSTRLTEAVTAGTATVRVTINGAAGTLNVVHTSVLNATGGQSTQQAGIDRFVAGDLIGLSVTTDAGFLPITTDLEAWLEIEEEP